MKDRHTARTARHKRIRAKLPVTADRPRLVVSRSLQHIRAQVIDDFTGKVIAAASDISAKMKGTKTDRAKAVGTELGKKAQAAGVTKVAFDRAGYKYHGRVKALADAARASGLQF